MTNPICIDISHHNPEPDWDILKANGTLGVIFKATEGQTYVDDTLFQRASRAKAAGLAFSTYHFLRPGSPEAQMDHYLGTIDPVEGERIVLDHEDAGFGLKDLEKCVTYLRAERPDLQITIYSGHLIKDQLAGKSSTILRDNTSLWIAQYNNSGPSWPTTVWPAWSLWQYTDQASVVGVSAKVDGNKWNGSPENFVKWLAPATGGEAPEPKPEPEPEPEPEIATVRLEISGPVEIWINGEKVEI